MMRWQLCNSPASLGRLTCHKRRNRQASGAILVLGCVPWSAREDEGMRSVNNGGHSSGEVFARQ